MAPASIYVYYLNTKIKILRTIFMLYLFLYIYFFLFVFLLYIVVFYVFFFFFQAEDGIRDRTVTGVQTRALPILFRRGLPHVAWIVGYVLLVWLLAGVT